MGRVIRASEGTSLVAMELYPVLKFLHVLAAIVWVGGSISVQILAMRVLRSGDPEHRYVLLGEFEFLGTRIYVPAATALLGLGVWMVIIGPWSFTQFWVVAALGMFAYSALSGILYLNPQLARTRTLAEAEGVASPNVEAKIRGLFVHSRIELAFLVLIVFDMVVKPFS